VAQGWTIADDILQQQMIAWLKSLYPLQPWYVDLFTNDYTSEPGDTAAEYVLPDWPGYSQVEIQAQGWGPVTVTDHVASTTQATSCVFPAPPDMSGQVVYGYLVTDYYGNLVYAESWATPVTIPPAGGLTLIPVLRSGIQCVPLAHNARGAGRKKKVVVVTPDDDDDEE
jgi:hypothetical protein